MVGIVSNLSDFRRTSIDKDTHALSDPSKCTVKSFAFCGPIKDLGAFVEDRVTALNDRNRENLLRLSA